MKIKLKADPRLFYIISIIGFWVMIFSIYDIIYDKGFMIAVLVSFGVLLALIIFLIFFGLKKEEVVVNTIEEFEKKLHGGLFHFKCPLCEGIFAIKKSKSNDEKPIKMTCPDCGTVGVVPPNPPSIEEVIPEKKSMKANFRCISCSEGITVWAEGTELYKNINVFSCPFCGQEQTMNRV